MGLIKPFFLGFVIVTIGCHVGLRDPRRHPGCRPGHDQCRRRRVGGGDRGGFLPHAIVDYLDVLMQLTRQRSAELERRWAGPNAPIVVFDRVSLAFDDKVILRDVSFTLLTGHTKIFLGASGAGKSTILKLILGLAAP